MRHLLFFFRSPVALLALFFCGLPAAALAEDGVLILHINDFHGQVLPKVRSNGDREGGVRALIAKVQERRQSFGADRVLTLDAGDWFQGTPEGNWSHGRLVIDLWNLLGVDAAVVGNHDFDAGVANLQQLCQRAWFPVLGSNVVDDQGRVRSFLKPWIILEVGGIRFGILGLLSERTPEIVMPAIGRELHVSSAVETCRRAIPEMKEMGAECIVVLSHLGMGTEQELAGQVPEIHLIVGGHSHTAVQKPWRVGSVVGVQAACRAQFLGELQVRRGGENGFVMGGRLIPISEAEGEQSTPQVERCLDRYLSVVRESMEEVVGVAKESISPSPRTAGVQSSPLGNWLCDVMASYSEDGIAVHNRGGIRDSIDPGPVTIRQLYEISPFGNEVSLIRIRGEDLWQVIAKSLSESKVRLEIGGMRVFWKQHPDRVELMRVMIGETLLDRDRTYQLATNSYLATGGDGWSEFTQLGEPVSCGLGVFEASREALKKVKILTADETQRFVEVE